MTNNERKLDGAKLSVAKTVTPEKLEATKHTYADPLESSRKGVAGIVETTIRRFKSLSHLAMIFPVYALACIILGAAAAPGIAMFEFITSFAPAIAIGGSAYFRYFLVGSGLAAGYFTYGFALIFLVPLVNFCLRTSLKTWRGPYYSLEAIRWYIHNGATYLVRFTFLEFVTPTPFNLLFYKMMGMKIGRGSTINSTWISDPSLISLGEKVTIGGSVTLIGHYGQGGYLVLAPTHIGNKVTIGLKATIMGGVTIGDGAKILPNSVVLPKTIIPAGETWGGVPACKLNL
jgi:hypothetical protein